MPGLPVVRDLIVDMKQFFDQLEKVKPYLITKSDTPDIERKQSPEDREDLDGLYECILCGCCSTSCFLLFGGIQINFLALQHYCNLGDL